ncbi:MAG: DUF983 domain-containing protein [Alphaproteobacteria bacterium]
MPTPLATAFSCTCPRCGRGRLFDGYLKIVERCDSCGLALAKNDSGDGPAVFLIFVLGALIVGLAIWTEVTFAPPYWVHVAIWPVVTLALTLALLRPLKAYVIALQYRHRRSDFERD